MLRKSVSSRRKRGQGGFIGVIFIVKLFLMFLGIWIIYSSWQAGTLSEDMSRYSSEVIEVAPGAFGSESDDSSRSSFFSNSGNSNSSNSTINAFQEIKEKMRSSR